MHYTDARHFEGGYKFGGGCSARISTYRVVYKTPFHRALSTMSRLRHSQLRRFYSTSRPPLTVGIRCVLHCDRVAPRVAPYLPIPISREDPQRIWERRAPLTPEDVHYLVSEKKVDVHVEPCDRRVFPATEYAKVCITTGLRDECNHPLSLLHTCRTILLNRMPRTLSGRFSFLGWCKD